MCLFLYKVCCAPCVSLSCPCLVCAFHFPFTVCFVLFITPSSLVAFLLNTVSFALFLSLCHHPSSSLLFPFPLSFSISFFPLSLSINTTWPRCSGASKSISLCFPSAAPFIKPSVSSSVALNLRRVACSRVIKHFASKSGHTSYFEVMGTKYWNCRACFLQRCSVCPSIEGKISDVVQ